MTFSLFFQSNVTDGIQHGIHISRRSRREPAVWGEPAPDYSGVQLNDYIHFLNALIFVDSKIVCPSEMVSKFMPKFSPNRYSRWIEVNLKELLKILYRLIIMAQI